MNLLTNESSIWGEFSLCHVFEGEGTSEYTAMVTEMEEEENYLQRGEKILTLLRKKAPREFKQDKTLELVKENWEKTVSAVARSVSVNLEEKFLELDLEEEGESAACDMLSEALGNIVWFECEPRGRVRDLMRVLCKGKEKEVLRAHIGDLHTTIPVGAKFSTRYEPSCGFKREKVYYPVANFQTFIAQYYLRNYLLQALRKIYRESENEEAYAQVRSIGILQNFFCRDSKVTDIRKKTLSGLTQPAQRCFGILIFYPCSDDAAEAVMELGIVDLYRMLRALSDEYLKKKEEARMERVLSGDYALSYQTKKNIPKKYLLAMRKSSFNDYFGYCEIDADCDLANIKEIEKEYRALSSELRLPAYPEVSLRFRKLGNHKASGLYYPTLKCLCVDVRTPSSFAHEVGHMIDYHCAHISDKYDFYAVHERYETLLREYTRKAPAKDTSVLRGSTKYNLSYYLMPTEVFARCFELYLIRERKIDNSLVKPDGSFAYPQDEKLDAEIKEFFDGLLKKIEVKEEAA